MPTGSFPPQADPVPEGTCIPINSDADIVAARQTIRTLAERLGLPTSELTLISTALSELARSIIQSAEQGEIILKLTGAPDGKPCMMVRTRDKRPTLGSNRPELPNRFPIADGSEAGLLEAIKHVEEFEIALDDEQGAVLVVKKWKD